jgi:hypothetical protein
MRPVIHFQSADCECCTACGVQRARRTTNAADVTCWACARIAGRAGRRVLEFYRRLGPFPSSVLACAESPTDDGKEGKAA